MTSASPPPPDPKIAAKLGNLPRFQPTALRLIAISPESDNALEEYEKIFRADPSLASEALLRANSVEFGLQGRISDIRGALLFLGIDRTCTLAFTICLNLYLNKTSKKGDTRPIWLHSMASAVIAEDMARQWGLAPLSCYTAALMHDLGRLGLLASCGAEYQRILTTPCRSVEEANALERIAFGMNHCDAGMYLARSWGFPGGLCEVIQRHHEVPEEGPVGVLELVGRACRMATRLGYPEVIDAAGAACDSTPDADTDRLAEKIRASIRVF